MIEGRPDWVVTPPALWGHTRITFFVHEENSEYHPKSAELLEEVAKRIEKKGIEAWFSLNVQRIAGRRAADYEKLTTRSMCRFDSGSTHLPCSSSAKNWLGLPTFISKAATSTAAGFHRDADRLRHRWARALQAIAHPRLRGGSENGRKMSKSLGNVVARRKKCTTNFGADILRLWTASTDYSGEVGDFQRNLEARYRKLPPHPQHLELSFADLSDFSPIEHAVPQDQMVEIDRYAMILARQLQERLAGDFYPRYAFHFAVKDIVAFCSVDLGAFYLDILKDRLYTTQVDSHARRSAQTALYHITRSLVLLISPILCFTGEEAWDIIGGGEEDSVLFHTWHDSGRSTRKAKKRC